MSNQPDWVTHRDDEGGAFPRQSEQDVTQLTYVFAAFIGLLFLVALGAALITRWMAGC